MNLKNEFEPIREWADRKGIYDNSTNLKQYEKFEEEVDELWRGLKEGDKFEIGDAIGDCVVCLTNIAHLSGLRIEDCIIDAYNVINKRTGIMRDGVFVKDS